MSSVHLHEHREEAPAPRLEEVSPGVFAYVQLDGSWGLNNPGFFVGKHGVVVIDTCFSERRSRAFRQAIERTTSLPLRTLINTHSHGDHTFGNYLFRETTIVAHQLCRKDVIASGLSAQSRFPGVEWGAIEIEPPMLTFEERLAVYVDDLRLELEFVGPAHTTNDVYVWAPERKLLFSGDLVFSGCTPFIIMGSLAGHLVALEKLRALGAEIVVPGHGDLCGPEAIEDCIAYLRFVQEVARRAFDAGLMPLAAARETDLGRFGEWQETERLVANIHRAYSEIRGEPLGSPMRDPAAFNDMLVMNGGKPLRCLV